MGLNIHVNTNIANLIHKTIHILKRSVYWGKGSSGILIPFLDSANILLSTITHFTHSMRFMAGHRLQMSHFLDHNAKHIYFALYRVNVHITVDIYK